MLKKTIVRREPVSTIPLSGNIHPVLQRVYAARGLGSADEFDYSLNRLLPSTLLKNIEAAAALLASAMASQKRMVIVADYDADGATACALGVRGLRAMGAENVDYIVPDRFEHGYGLSTAIVELAAELRPELLITVDNGISSVEGVELARKLGMDVLITDHHIPGPVLPPATVIVNPNLRDDLFPSKALAGVGVMFYVLAALRASLRQNGWFASQESPEPNLARYLDLVALGTVADVVPLDYNNRILVAQGLQRIRKGHCVPGISALLEVAGRHPQGIVSADLGFVVGPRLNAAGRLEDMRLGIECLLCDSPVAARQMAARLDELNRERRKIQAGMETEAMAAFESLELDPHASLPDGMCLYQDNWHQGVIGVLASKIREKVHRPVIAFAGESEEVLKGSARSIRGIHIRDVIDTIATAHPGLVLNYGGHAMAAGLSLRLASFEKFTTLFNDAIGVHIAQSGFDSELVSDGELEPDDFSIELAEIFRDAGPWGQGFPEPRFDGCFNILESRIVAGKHLKLRLGPENGRGSLEAIAFNTTDESWPGGYNKVQALYRLDVNEYRGSRSLQLVIEHIEPLRVNAPPPSVP